MSELGTLKEIEKRAIAHALSECGSISQAAKRLGIHRRTLQRKLARKAAKARWAKPRKG